MTAAPHIANGDIPIRLDVAATLYRLAERAADAGAAYFAALRSVGTVESGWQSTVAALEESEIQLGLRVDEFGYKDDGQIGPIRGIEGRRVLIEYWHSSTGRAFATARWIADQDIDLQAAARAQNAPTMEQVTAQQERQAS